LRKEAEQELASGNPVLYKNTDIENTHTFIKEIIAPKGDASSPW
jgi:hypothetical protein